MSQTTGSQQGGSGDDVPWYRRKAVVISLGAIGLLRLLRRTRARVERHRSRVALKELRRGQRQDARAAAQRRESERRRRGRRRRRG